jgi:hypothetical protein
MTAPIDDDDDKLNGIPPDAEQEDSARRKKKGEGDAQGAGSGIAKMLTTRKSEQVKGEHRHLVGAELVEAIVEFFSELPMRASANLSVAWEKTKTNAKSFAIVNWIIEHGDKAVRDFIKSRDRDRGAARDSRGLQQRRPVTAQKKGPGSKGMTMMHGPAGPSK